MSKSIKTAVSLAGLASVMALTTSGLQAGTIQWGTTFRIDTANGNAPNTTAPASGNWSAAANWTYRSGTDLGTAGIPDSGDVAQIGLTDTALTITVDGTYDLLRLEVKPRTSGFSGKNVTLNSSSGLLRIGANGVLLDNGGLVAVNVPIQLTADQTFSGGTNNPGAIANFNTTISGNFKITRSASQSSTFQFYAGNSTFNGFVQASQTTRIGNNPSGSAGGGGPLGSGVLELTGGTIQSDGTTARAINNATELRGNIVLGATATYTGTLTFATTWTGTTFNIHSSTNNVSRTITTNSAVIINHAIGETGGGTGLGLTKAGTAALTFGGATSNTYAGLTTVNAGQLDLNKSGGAVAVAGNLTIGDGSGTDTVRLLAANQIADTSVVTLGSGAVLNLNNLSDTIGSLRGVGTAQSGTGVLTVATQLAPGASAGTLTVTNTTGASGEFVLASTASLAYELLGTDQTAGGGINDLTTVTGDLTLDGTLNVSELVAGSFLSAADGDTWLLFSYTGVLTDNGLALGSMPSLSSGLSFDVDTTVAGQVILIVVPEPASLGLLGLAGAMFLRRRNRS